MQDCTLNEKGSTESDVQSILHHALVNGLKIINLNVANSLFQIRDCLRLGPRKLLVFSAEDNAFPSVLPEKSGLQLHSLVFGPGFNSKHSGSDSIGSILAVRSSKGGINRGLHWNLLMSHFYTCLPEKRPIANQALIFPPCGRWNLPLKLTLFSSICEWLYLLNYLFASKRTAEV